MPPAKRATKRAAPVLTTENPVEQASVAAIEAEDRVEELVPVATEAEDQAVEDAELVSGSAVLLPDGGEAILLGIEDGEALLRCGTLHHDPIRCPADRIIPVDAADETPRHERFRREALRRGEIELFKEDSE